MFGDEPMTEAYRCRLSTKGRSLFLLSLACLSAACDGGPSVGAEAGSGTTAQQGGVNSSGGNGTVAQNSSGAASTTSSSGGATTTSTIVGGASSFGGTASGGTTTEGGALGSGGGSVRNSSTTGGSIATGGNGANAGTATGGFSASAGRSASGGAATGGNKATGGAATAGNKATGGVTTGGRATGGGGPAGGAPPTGGTKATGGNAPGGGAAGAAGATSCPYQGHVSYTLAKSASPTAAEQAAYDKITPAMDTAIRFYNCYANITKAINVTYNSSVATADGNINGSIRFGSTASMNHVTAMHEVSHTVGIGTASNWGTFVVNGKFTGTNANAQLLAIPNRLDDTIGADTQHFWPYGLNYESEGQHDSDLIGHCQMVVAIRKDLGMS
jgi:hypothetical protein